MATWTSFYINTSQKEAVVQKLAGLTDDLVRTNDAEFPADIGQYHMIDTKRAPTYMAIGNPQSEWTTIVHNSFSKLDAWGLLLSKHFSCKLIVTMAQSVSSSYYFALYENGIKLREIETCYTEDFDEINFGNPFSFENPRPGKKSGPEGKEDYIFSFVSIEEYCAQFNLAIQTDYGPVSWTLLRGKGIRNEVQDYVRKLMVKKPWWKFW